MTSTQPLYRPFVRLRAMRARNWQRPKLGSCRATRQRSGTRLRRIPLIKSSNELSLSPATHYAGSGATETCGARHARRASQLFNRDPGGAQAPTQPRPTGYTPCAFPYPGTQTGPKGDALVSRRASAHGPQVVLRMSTGSTLTAARIGSQQATQAVSTRVAIAAA